jgi:hypothetical protein
MRLFNALKFYASRALETVRKAREPSDREEHGVRSSVPGRHEAS